MKIDCPCRDCTTETGRSPTCHNVETCERWAKYKEDVKAKTKEFYNLQKTIPQKGATWTAAGIKRKANGPKYKGSGRQNNYIKGW